ncbi:hypothetical protein FB45DRAFT_449543 [Roridomyces roridus]|uniref:DUF6535 domain-containing protein n=1 Tax=Roridomyces roridus TaxID=1738132 RepID=A0AAD7FT77_9AGAR|nr:hypothetical protein FB45DRAFT_449543 [Roridomyces roridus]
MDVHLPSLRASSISIDDPTLEHDASEAHAHWDESRDGLVAALRGCFAELIKENQTQMSSLQAAIEELKPKKPVVDNKTGFWNAYKSVSDEYDKEYQQKYSTDLDTSLIFAGLFSAVTSAFIIQIQPQIQGPVGGAPLNSISTTVPIAVLASQCLLYVSLSATLLAALLAVLGKQWLMYYSSAGEKGTIEARGLERQRKFDGLRRWKFDAVMHLFPLMLQFALLVFGVALSVYLWTVHVALAVIVVGFTGLGVLAYVSFMISAGISPDSPFWSPLAPVLPQLFANFRAAVPVQFIWGFIKPLWPKRTPELIPLYSKQPHNSQAFILPGEFPPVSPEVAAVSWMLETSSDPQILSVCAETAVGLQWPATVTNLPFLMGRLRDSFLHCLYYYVDTDGSLMLYRVRSGMTRSAVHFGQAYCTLRVIDPGLEKSEGWARINPSWNISGSPELMTVLEMMSGFPRARPILSSGDVAATRWALHVLPSLDDQSGLETFLARLNVEGQDLHISLFPDYLFCIHVFVSETIPAVEDVIRVDKSAFQGFLIVQIFKNLTRRIANQSIELDTVTTVVKIVVRVVQSAVEQRVELIKNQSGAEWLFDFCSRLLSCWDGNTKAAETVHAALTLIPRYLNTRWEESLHIADTGWIYRALDHLPHKDVEYLHSAVMDFLQLLLCCKGGLDTKPPISSFRIIVQQLSLVENSSYWNSKIAFAYLNSASRRRWFNDGDIQEIVLEKSLGRSLEEITTMWSGRIPLSQPRLSLW